jgi:hypothetical protein
MEHPLQRRLALGVTAVAVVAALLIAALWSAHNRFRGAPPTVAAAPSGAAPDLEAENLRLRAEVARLTAERDRALAAVPVRSAPVHTASPEPALPSAQSRPQPVPVANSPGRRLPEPVSAPPLGSFSEPQTFSSTSTH